MRVAFYIDNKNINEINCNNIEYSNPGIGGSEYLCILIANSLCKRGNVDITLLADKESIFPESLKWDACGDLENAISKYQNKIDIFIIDSKKFKFQLAQKYPHVNFILWVNNAMSFKEIHQAAKFKNIIKIVHVSREMYDLYRDSELFKKSTYIFNAVTTENILRNTQTNFCPADLRKNYVVYIGSIVPNKGFHILAKYWKEIKQKVPDAELFVIGSGKLYNKNAKLGKYNIAEEKYEKSFIKYITDDSGKIIPSVHFLGILGEDKYEILKQCKVGIPNPSGETETFGYTAVEMELLGCKVTTKYCPGYIDTVYDTRFLYKNEKQIVNNTVNLLKNKNNYDYEGAVIYIKDNFDISIISSKWENLIDNINNSTIYPMSKRSNYHIKYIKECIRLYLPEKVKKYIPLIERLYSNRIRTYINSTISKLSQ